MTSWQPAKPRLRPLRLLVTWIVAAASLYVAAGLVPGVHVNDVEGAFLVAAVIAVINAILPPLVASLRLPYMLALGFVLLLVVDALALMIADEVLPEFFTVDRFRDALLAALVMSAVTLVLEVV